MIPTIGLMIGAYILLRCCDTLTRSRDHFTSPRSATAMRFLAIVCLVVTAFFIVELLLSGSGVAPSGLSGSVPARSETCKDPHQRVGLSGDCFCESGYHTDPTTFKCIRD